MDGESPSFVVSKQSLLNTQILEPKEPFSALGSKLNLVLFNPTILFYGGFQDMLYPIGPDWSGL